MAVIRRTNVLLVATVVALLLGLAWFGAALEAKTTTAEDAAELATTDAVAASNEVEVSTAVDDSTTAEDALAAQAAAIEDSATEEDTTGGETTGGETTGGETTGDETTGDETTGGETTRDETTVDTTTDDGVNCVRPREVTTFSGSDDRRTASFRITGDTFRIRFDTEPVGTDPISPSVEVDVLEDGEFIDEGFVALDGEDGRVNIPAGPGTFRLEITAEESRYTISVDDCLGDNGRNGDDDVDDIVEVDDDVIASSIPKKRLPDTGGPGLLPVAAAMLLTGAAVGALLARRR